eukprot:TRINITY_DN95571_c0_g1_i1.p1 TRINITY_DN95571_c0_g1~~TRINITY_DN95571_c0_g1_i1.p1  ORF type:complete len:210 (+),score=23.86 TRINITY_DN95571_c0_g1_i1:13-642(+)
MAAAGTRATLCFALLCSRAASCSFEEVAALRGQSIADSYKPALLQGRWYEQSYADAVQFGAGCQTMDAAVDNTTGVLSTNFSVIYKVVPFTIREIYEPHAIEGVFRKSAEAPFNLPGGHLVGLPTALVDAQLDASGTRYDSITFYSCFGLGFTTLQALEIFTRNATVDDAYVQDLYERATSAGVSIPRSSLRRVSREGCRSDGATVMWV